MEMRDLDAKIYAKQIDLAHAKRAIATLQRSAIALEGAIQVLQEMKAGYAESTDSKPAVPDEGTAQGIRPRSATGGDLSVVPKRPTP